MLLSKASIYGLRAVLYLAAGSNDRYVSISRISEELDLSPHFLTKILQELTSAGLMESMKGPKGGVRFTRSKDEINLLDIVAAIDGTDLLTECVLGLPGCGTEKPCPMHDRWARARDNIQEMLAQTTLAELARKGREGNMRLTANGNFNWLTE